MKEIERLLDEVRKEKRPTPGENATVARTAAEFVSKLERALKAARIGARPIVGGSGAKGTWLRGMHDIDVFACFDYGRHKEKSAELSEFLAAAVKKAFQKHERLHGSRDYFKVHFKGYNFEIVPILRITKASQAKNITDASLLHAGWVQKKIRKRPGLEDEIRLTKAFCKAQRAYGAESYVRGFSGYACEVLTAYHGGFLKLITAASTKWKKQVAAGKKIVVDAEGHYKGRDPTRELNEAKVQSELIVIDPVQKDRNATAALSSEVLQRFIAAAEGFMRRPSKSNFEKQEITEEALRQKAKGKILAVVKAKPLSGKEDVVGAKLVKAFEHILNGLKENGFTVPDSGWEWARGADAIFWYITAKKEPEDEVRYGPPLANKMHSERFRNEHAGKSGREIFEKGGRLYARIERKYKQPQQLMKSLLPDEYLKDKASAYTLL